MSPTCRVAGASLAGGPGAVPVAAPETQDLVGIVSDIDALERIRDQLEVE